MRRFLALLLPSVLLVSGCQSGPRKIDDATAHRTAVEAWGVGFETGHYDIFRELSRDEQQDMDREISKKAGKPLHAQGSVLTANSPPDRVVDEIKKLGPGCALSFCQTWHVEKRSGDVIEMGTQKPSRPIPFSVVSRDADGTLHASRFEASSHEEALSRR